MALSDELSKFIPKDFGKKKKAAAAATAKEDVGKALADKHAASDSVAKIAAEEQKPEAPPLKAGDAPDTAAQTRDNDDDGDSDSDEEYPIGSHIAMKEHAKTVSALAWDPNGDVLVSGDNGSLVHMWNFSTMDGAYRPTRTLVPFEGQQIRDLRFN
ncbi:hypothetical protein GGH95_006502, partial [Coemansia sp. RSA 1836]